MIWSFLSQYIPELLSGGIAFIFGAIALLKTKQNTNLKRDKEELQDYVDTQKRMADADNTPDNAISDAEWLSERAKRDKR